MSFSKGFKILTIGAIVCCITACWDTGEGQKTGISVKLSQEGLFVKTYECELVRGGFSSGSGVNGKSFHFTIENKALVKKIQEAFQNEKEVIIKYHTEAF